MTDTTVDTGPTPGDEHEFFRSFRPDLSVRSHQHGGDGRTIYGIAVPYNTPVRIHERLVEQFAPTAFDHQLRSARFIRFAREHMALGGDLIGAVHMLRSDPGGLYFEARVAKTNEGDNTLALVESGALQEVSVHFRSRQVRTLVGGIVERVKADLREIAVVLEGAYGQGAVIAGMRSKGAMSPPAVPGIPLSGPDLETLDLREKANVYLNGGIKALPDYELEIKRVQRGY